MIKHFIYSLVAIIILFSTNAFAQDIYDNPEKFAKYNPDGEKYDFARHYMIALEYLETNIKRDRERGAITDENLARQKFINKEMDEMLQQNANLRVARNMLKRYLTSENGLMLKSATLFSQMCDRLIASNNKERKQLEQFLENVRAKQITEDYLNFFKYELSLNQRDRKVALGGILEASILTSKVLISEKLNQYNELAYLGMTGYERGKLLTRIGQFEGSQYAGELRPGQSFLEGSVTVIRTVLEDGSFQPLAP